MDIYRIQTANGGISKFLFERVPLYIWIIIATSVVSLALFVAGAVNPAVFGYAALTPSLIISGSRLWTLITHIFAHGGIFHLFVNMFSLFFIGRVVEQIIGRKRFFWFYIIAGVFAGAFSALLAGFFGFGIGARLFGSSDVMMLGASGAIFGLLGIMAVLVPNKRIILFAGPIVVVVFGALSGLFLSGAILSALEFLLDIALIVMVFALLFPFNSFSRIAVPITMPLWLAPIAAIVPLAAISFFMQLPIGNAAHFGGLIAGLAYGVYLRIKFRKKVKLLQRYFR
jgi:hypothetical protein